MKASELTERALAHGVLTRDELRWMLALPPLSEDAAMVRHAARRMVGEICANKAEVYGQVGIDCGPCPEDCLFCSFAVSNEVFEGPSARGIDEVVTDCLRLEGDGANAIFLEATARIGLPAYLPYVRAVRVALRDETVLVANVDDFDDDGAHSLAAAGCEGVYHVVHMGEGTLTRIPVQRRLDTIAAARRSGLRLGTAIEPIGSEQSLDDIVARAELIRRLKPAHSGVSRRITIPRSSLAVHPELDSSQTAILIAAAVLFMGYTTNGYCGEHQIGSLSGINLAFAEVGSNPRDTAFDTVRGGTVALRRAELRDAGWDVLDGPSAMFRP